MGRWTVSKYMWTGEVSTEDIAHAFLVSPETMKRRLTRAKTRIKEVGIPFRVPPAELLTERLAAVLAVVDRIFNEGYAGRVDLASEAIHLGRVLARPMPGEPEVHGLLARVDRLDLALYPYFHSTRAELLRRLGRVEEARSAYRRALELIRSGPERRFLQRRLLELL